MADTEAVYRTLMVFAQYKDLARITRSDPSIAVTHLLHDLRHYCQEYGVDFNACLADADERYEAAV